MQPFDCISGVPMSDLTYSFSTDRPVEEAYDAVCDVRSWWTGDITGPTDRLGAEWDYTVPGVHWSAFRVTELEPGRWVAWLCTGSRLSFTVDPAEWTGTTVTFDLLPTATGSEVRFTHRGLTDQAECYGVCRDAWREYVLGGLRERVGAGSARAVRG
jgi:hypothetical protein